MKIISQMSPRYFPFIMYTFLSRQPLRVDGASKAGRIRNAICQVGKCEVIYCRQKGTKDGEKINFGEEGRVSDRSLSMLRNFKVLLRDDGGIR